MASNTMKQTCAKCDKGGGIAMCNGCQRSFCIKHFVEHRQELSQQMDTIGQEHDLLRRDMNYENNAPALLARIDRWEQEAMRTIQASAQKARIDLQQLLDRTRNELQMSVNRLTEELRTCREADDYTEVDTRKWTEQLRELRQMIENPSSINIECENIAASAIPLIKVIDLPRLTPASNQERQFNENDNRVFEHHAAVFREKFAETYGSITLSPDGLTGYCSDDHWDGSCISGIGRYSSGIHHIHLRIENRTSNFLFFGIITASQTLTSLISKVKSACGWWDLSFAVINGSGTSGNQWKNIHSGDDITLILNCDDHLIQLKHHRLDKFVQMPIDLGQCPFPWKLVIRLDCQCDCVKIFH